MFSVKKLFSLILALSMLLTTIPAVFAVESEVPGEELTVDSVSIEPAADEAAPEEPAGLISAPASAEEVDDDSEALARHARAEARAEALRADVEDRSGLTPSAGQFTTMATNCSVTVRVTFPQAATDSGRVRISLHVPDVMDENGFVSQPSYIYTSQWVTVSKGATYASATFTVPAGSYFASVYAQSPNFGICMNTYHYFNADGSVATNAYTAQPTAISGTRTISVTAPKAPRTISGTVQFSSPLTEDTWFEFYMGTTARWGSSYIYPTFFAAQGATSLSFSIPVSANSYYMELYNHSNGRYGYYDTNGQLSNNWSSRAYVSVVDESVSGLVIDGDCLLGEVDEEEGEVSVWHAANVTINLPETLTLDISAPEGFSGYYEGQISLYVQETYEIVCNQHFWFDGSSTTAALTLPADLADGSYALRVYLYNGSGVITDSTRFWTESGWVTSLSDAQPIDFSVGELSITLPAAKSATVTVNAPEGFSGYYDGYIYLYEDTETGFATVASQYFEFEGSGCDVTLYLPAESESDTYKMAVYLWSGPGCPTDTTYYYAEAGWATSYSSGDYVDFSSGAVSITLPRAKVISGKLVASDGSAVSVPSGAGFTMYSSSGSYANCSSTMSEDGTFTITVSDTLTGDYYLYCSAYSGGGNNVVAGTYYYKSDATSSVYEYDSSDSSYFINLDNGDVTDLVIYVDTGYVLTGTVELGEGATLTNPDSKTLGWVYVSLASETRRTSFSVRLRSDNSDWSYSVAVPKAAATYTLSAYLSPNSSAVTNIYLGDMDYGTVDVTGDGALPSISLTPGRATISADITTPLSGYYTNGRLYVVTSNGTYSRDFYMDNNVSSTTVSVTVAPDDNAETYQLYYYLGNPEGLIRYRDVYVNADGSCTTDSTAASSYSFDTTEHAFTLAEQPPYLMGKIYLPDELDDDDFYVRLYDRFSGGAYFRVHSSTIEEDPDGRKYVPYKKYSSGDYSGSSFYAYYYLSDYTGTALYNKSDYYSRAYLGEDGTFTFDGNSDYHYFTVPDSGCAELDFTLLSWNDGTEDALLQSAHGLTAFEEQTFTFSYPGATYLEVTFDGRTDIDLYINDSYYNAYSLRSYTQTIYLGDTDGVMTVTVPAYTASSATFGFAITSIVPYYPDEAAQTPSVAAVYSAGGSAEADVMASLAAGETVYVSLVGPVDLTGIIGVAVYNSNGRMIDMIWEGLTFENGVVSLPLNFDNAESGVTLSIVVLDAVSWAPLAADTTFSTEG